VLRVLGVLLKYARFTRSCRPTILSCCQLKGVVSWSKLLNTGDSKVTKVLNFLRCGKTMQIDVVLGIQEVLSRSLLLSTAPR